MSTNMQEYQLQLLNLINLSQDDEQIEEKIESLDQYDPIFQSITKDRLAKNYLISNIIDIKLIAEKLFSITNDTEKKEFISHCMNKLQSTSQFISKLRTCKRREENNIKAHLSLDLRLDGISTKEQQFSIAGWINVIWKEPDDTALYETMKQYFHSTNDPNIWYYDSEPKMRIIDLRKADKISYYLPIDARKIFSQNSIRSIEYIDAPYIEFNPKTNVMRTEYHIVAALSEHYELFYWPFDKQFLNIKLRWNSKYYKLLSWEDEQQKEIPITDGWFGDVQRDIERYKSFSEAPLKIALVEELHRDILLHSPWVGLDGFNSLQERVDSGLRFALIRLRFTRNPVYYITYVLLPVFLIVLSGFSVYGIPFADNGNRLEVSVTVLLTFTAFQSIIGNELPNTCEMVFIDYYIILAQLVIIGLIFGTVYPSLSSDTNDDNEPLDKEIGLILFSVWILFSVIYVAIGVTSWFMRDGKFWKMEERYWQRRGSEEIESWKNEQDMTDYVWKNDYVKS